MVKDKEAKIQAYPKNWKEAENLKSKGNNFLKSGQFIKASEFYKKALLSNYFNKYVWTNRALALMKAGKHGEAINDCTKVLEICETLSGGLEPKDVCFKALIRRAKSLNNVGNVAKALEDVDKALTLFPGEETAQKLRKELGGEEKDNKPADAAVEQEGGIEAKIAIGLKNQGEGDKVDIIDGFVELVESDRVEETKNYDYTELYKVITKAKNPKVREYFVEKGGLKAIQKVAETGVYRLTTVNLDPKGAQEGQNKDKGPTLFINFLHRILAGNIYFIDYLIRLGLLKAFLTKILTNYRKLYPEVGIGFNLPTAKPEDDNEGKSSPEGLTPTEREFALLEIEELAELVTLMTESTTCRIYLEQRSHFTIPIFIYTFDVVFKSFTTEYQLLSSMLTLYSNLLVFRDWKANKVPTNELTDYVNRHYLGEVFTTAGLFLRLRNPKFINCKKSLLAFIANYLNNGKARDYVITRLIGCSKEDNSERCILDERELNPPLFFLESLISDSIELVEYSVLRFGKLAHNSLHFYKNMSAIFLNCIYGFADRNNLPKLVKVLNEKRISLMGYRVTKTLLDHKPEEKAKAKENNEQKHSHGPLPDDAYGNWQYALGSVISIFARFYSKEFGPRNDTEVILYLKKLLGYYDVKNIDKNEMITNEVTKLIVTFIQLDPRLRPGTMLLLKKEPQIIDFHVEVVKLTAIYNALR